MASIRLCVALALSVCCGVDGRAYQVTLPGRSLLQSTVNTVAARIRVVNFASVLNSSGDVKVDEEELQGSINVTSSDEPVLYGAYFLGPSQVAQINHTIATERVCSCVFLRCFVPRVRWCLLCCQGKRDHQSDRRRLFRPTIAMSTVCVEQN
jgi:hypothetical protein